MKNKRGYLKRIFHEKRRKENQEKGHKKYSWWVNW